MPEWYHTRWNPGDDDVNAKLEWRNHKKKIIDEEIEFETILYLFRILLFVFGARIQRFDFFSNLWFKIWFGFPLFVPIFFIAFRCVSAYVESAWNRFQSLSWTRIENEGRALNKGEQIAVPKCHVLSLAHCNANSRRIYGCRDCIGILEILYIVIYCATCWFRYEIELKTDVRERDSEDEEK